MEYAYLPLKKSKAWLTNTILYWSTVKYYGVKVNYFNLINSTQDKLLNFELRLNTIGNEVKYLMI